MTNRLVPFLHTKLTYFRYSNTQEPFTMCVELRGQYDKNSYENLDAEINSIFILSRNLPIFKSLLI